VRKHHFAHSVHRLEALHVCAVVEHEECQLFDRSRVEGERLPLD